MSTWLLILMVWMAASFAIVLFGTGWMIAYEIVRCLADRKSLRRITQLIEAEEERQIRLEARRLGLFADAAREIERLPTIVGVED